MKQSELTLIIAKAIKSQLNPIIKELKITQELIVESHKKLMNENKKLRHDNRQLVEMINHNKQATLQNTSRNSKNINKKDILNRLGMSTTDLTEEYNIPNTIEPKIDATQITGSVDNNVTTYQDEILSGLDLVDDSDIGMLLNPKKEK